MQIVDVHSHLYPRVYIDLLKSRAQPPCIIEDAQGERFVAFDAAAESEPPGHSIDSAYWNVEAKLRFLNEAGIGQALVSLGNPWLDPFHGDIAVAHARALNDEFAALEPKTGGRLVGLGVLPQREPEEAALVAEEIGASPTLYGIMNGCTLCGRSLGDPGLDPVWDVLERLKLPLLLHPHYGIGSDALREPGYMLALSFPFETTVALVRLVLGGVLERFPNLRVVAAHGGGTLPYVAGRVNAVLKTGALRSLFRPGLAQGHFSKLALDALVYGAGPLRSAVELVGPEHVMFGTDHPFAVADAAAGIAAIDAAFGGEERSLILGDAAIAYFGLPSVARSVGA